MMKRFSITLRGEDLDHLQSAQRALESHMGFVTTSLIMRAGLHSFTHLPLVVLEQVVKSTVERSAGRPEQQVGRKTIRVAFSEAEISLLESTHEMLFEALSYPSPSLSHTLRIGIVGIPYLGNAGLSLVIDALEARQPGPERLQPLQRSSQVPELSWEDFERSHPRDIEARIAEASRNCKKLED